MTVSTAVPSVSVDTCASVLRMSPFTIYRALQRGEIPGYKIGGYWRIPVQFLGVEYVPPPQVTKYDRGHDADQLAFEFDVPIIPVRRYRNTREVVRVGDYERLFSRGRKAPQRP